MVLGAAATRCGGLGGTLAIAFAAFSLPYTTFLAPAAVERSARKLALSCRCYLEPACLLCNG